MDPKSKLANVEFPIDVLNDIIKGSRLHDDCKTYLIENIMYDNMKYYIAHGEIVKFKNNKMIKMSMHVPYILDQMRKEAKKILNKINYDTRKESY